VWQQVRQRCEQGSGFAWVVSGRGVSGLERRIDEGVMSLRRWHEQLRQGSRRSWGVGGPKVDEVKSVTPTVLFVCPWIGTFCLPLMFGTS
jgi:hypothetical protein